MEFFGMAITVMAAILTYQAWKNGRWMKQAHNETQELIKGTQEMIRQMHKDTMETLKEIARLIIAEGERTRETIREAIKTS